MLLEEHYHEAPDVSYADDFDVVPDDIVIKSCLDQDEINELTNVRDFPVCSFPTILKLLAIIIYLI